jgi:signal transduction histidine kinase
MLAVRTLPEFIRRHRSRIMDDWLGEAKDLPRAHALTLDALRDHIPEFADTVNEIAHAHPERTFLSPPAEARGDFHVQWDKDRIAQALTNLLSNAVAHGGDPIIVESHDREHSITIAVRNAGEIPAPALATIFAPFAPPATERRHDGPYTAPERRRGHLGLGLYIVHEVAKAHGGHVSAQSERGETTFALTLPRAATAPDSSGMPNGRSADAIVGSN